MAVQKHYRSMSPPHHSSPDDAWWIFIFAVICLAQEANVVFVKLQGLTTVLSQQCAVLEILINT